MIHKVLIYIITFILVSSSGLCQKNEITKTDIQPVSLSNSKIELLVEFDNGIIQSETVQGKPEWLKQTGYASNSIIRHDGNFSLDIMWTDWRAPGKENNADNPIRLSKTDFRFKNVQNQQNSDGTKGLDVFFSGIDIPLEVKISYSLGNDWFYYKRKIAVRDTTQETNYLQSIAALDVKILNSNKADIMKDGGFGQPVALSYKTFGSFMALEYPAATNKSIQDVEGNLTVTCFQEIGAKITRNWLESEWVVVALVPLSYIKDWFFNYLENVRIHTAKPYTLYNSWYDLRSPEYPKVKPGNVMNEANVCRIIDLFKTNIIDKYKIHLDAFVLDDGWDIYESDWKMRPETFPNGMKPISDRLKGMGSQLGIWFGPTGGYSFRMKRVNWMKDHGYETVGKGRNYAMLCLGGKNYSQLFEKRITDLVSKEGIGYFKWDGIQFSCSEPDHGHPIGIFSRRAVMESVIAKCKAVRALDPNVYLNITSGTWLSPWWTKYADQIWMDGEDFGFSEVPCVHARDAAITYKDYVLYEDFTKKDLWFPLSNLMTHGIIKGNLETVGGDNDPIDKFTNDAAFYFARGVSMWELYISPDLLSAQEWNAMSTSINWALANWDILARTYMVGGDPAKAETYAYLHFKGNKGIVAARNPNFGPSSVKITLDPACGLDPSAANLVLERIYPNRWISPKIYSAGGTVELPLDAYETAIYEIYPLESATEPLYAGVVFYSTIDNKGEYSMHCLGKTESTRLLNPEIVDKISVNGKETAISTVILEDVANIRIFKELSTDTKCRNNFEVTPEVKKVLVSVLQRPEPEFKEAEIPELSVILDDKAIQTSNENQKGSWAWYAFDPESGNHCMNLIWVKNDKIKAWKGTAQVWLAADYSYKPFVINFNMKKPVLPRPLPAIPYPNDVIRWNAQLSVTKLNYSKP